MVKDILKRMTGYVLPVLVCIMLCACGQAPQSQVPHEQQVKEIEAQMTYEQITQDQAKALMAESENYIILDVRTEAEYAEGHIPGAICVPNETIGDNMPEELPDKDQLILVYCRSGNRSKQASEKLAKLGYTNVKEFGGINTWTGDIEK